MPEVDGSTLEDDIACLQGIHAVPPGFHDEKLLQRHRARLDGRGDAVAVSFPRKIRIGAGVLRRIRGHGTSVYPGDGLGFLLGSTDSKIIYAALPCAATRESPQNLLTGNLWGEQETDRQENPTVWARGEINPGRCFKWLKDGYGHPHAIGAAHELARRRGLAIVGLYHTVRGNASKENPLDHVPEPFAERLVLVWPGEASFVDEQVQLFRRTSRYRWDAVAFEKCRFRDPEMRLNPKRIHTDWLQMSGRRYRPAPRKIAYRPQPKPDASRQTGTRKTVFNPAAKENPTDVSAPEAWDSQRLPVDLKQHETPVLARIRDAVQQGKEIRVNYHGGTRSGRMRSIRPLEVFAVPSRQDVYVEVFDLDVDSKRTYRLDRIEFEPGEGM
jgi:hypothetical protein